MPGTPQESIMIDRFFFAAFTVSLLLGGTLAFGSEWLHSRTVLSASAVASAPRIVELPRVVVTAKRLASATTTARAEVVDSSGAVEQ
jgi:hypothetical protein